MTTHEFLAWLGSPGRRLHYSIGMTITEEMAEAILPTMPGAGRCWLKHVAGVHM